MKFSIITPTLFRDELRTTVESIDSQSYTDWEHIIIYDGVETPELRAVADGYESDKRQVYFTEEKYGDYGHTPRLKAWSKASGDYILYLDDDDWFINETFQTIVDELGDERPEWGIFPAWRNGEVFMTDEPKYGTITSVQHFQKKFDDKGEPIKWISGGHGADGIWAEEMAKKYKPFILNTRPLVRVDYASSGSFTPIPL